MKKFIIDLCEIGKDIISGLYFITVKGPALFMWWIGEAYSEKFTKESKDDDEDVIREFRATASDVCRAIDV